MYGLRFTKVAFAEDGAMKSGGRVCINVENIAYIAQNDENTTWVYFTGGDSVLLFGGFDKIADQVSSKK